MIKEQSIAIIDYGMGNLFSVQHACKCLGLNPVITSDGTDILNADGCILPGVGAFGEAMDNLKKLNLIEPIKAFIKSGKLFMGICLGMQLLFSESEEFGNYKGLNIIDGIVVKFPDKNKNEEKIKIPQIGWNSIFHNENKWLSSALKNTLNNEFMYFVHSYYAIPSSKQYILSFTNYEDIIYCSGFSRDNITAFQFHPEKSGKEGLKIYQAWADLIIKNKRCNRC